MNSSDRIAAQRYAQAYNDLSTSNDEAAQLCRALTQAAQALKTAHVYMTSPRVSLTAKQELVRTSLKDAPKTAAFLELLLAAKRYYLLDEIYSSQENYYKGVDLEKLTDEELVYAFNNNPQFPNGFELYGKESYTRIFKSATSVSNAKASIKDWIENDRYKVTHCLFIEERETYYGFYVRWENRKNPNENYDEKIMCFKSDIIQFTSGYYSFNGEECFGDISLESMQSILNQFHYFFFYQTVGCNVCISYIEQKEDIEYTLYYFVCIQGDWDMSNELHLIKRIITIDEQTGKFISVEELVVKTIFINN